MSRVDLTPSEQKAFDAFKAEHPEADSISVEVLASTGVGEPIHAVAHYGTKRSSRDITDYGVW